MRVSSQSASDVEERPFVNYDFQIVVEFVERLYKEPSHWCKVYMDKQIEEFQLRIVEQINTSVLTDHALRTKSWEDFRTDSYDNNNHRVHKFIKVKESLEPLTALGKDGYHTGVLEILRDEETKGSKGWK